MAEILSPGVKLPYVKPESQSNQKEAAAPDSQSNQKETAEDEAVKRNRTTGSSDGPDPDELLSGEGKTWSQWAVDQVKYAADGVVSNSFSEELLKEPPEGVDKTWSQWAAQNAMAAKDAAASNVKYVKNVAASGLANATGHSSDENANSEGRKTVTQSVVKKGVAVKQTLANGLGYAAGQGPKGREDRNLSAQDVVNRYSSTTSQPQTGGQQSLAKHVIDTGLGIKDGIAIHLGYGPNPDSPAGARAASIKEQAQNRTAALRSEYASIFNPGEEEKDLSKVITESLSHLPTLLKENVWVSSSGHRAESTSDNAASSTSSSTSETSSSTGGLVGRVAGAVSSATGAVTSYLPNSVSSYLPGRQAASPEPITPPEPTSTHEVHNRGSEEVSGRSALRVKRTEAPEPSNYLRQFPAVQLKQGNLKQVTFEEKLEKIEDDKLMELWTIGNAPLDFTVNTASLDTNSCFSHQTPTAPKRDFDEEVKQHNSHIISKDEAFADAHRIRVKLEANAYLEAELCKADAHAQKMLAKAEKHRLDEEAKALEMLKKEELRAELVMHNAEVKIEKILAQSKSRAASMRAAAEEHYARNLAEAKTKAERWKAEIEETKRREMADLQDRVEKMVAMDELPAPSEHRGVVQKVKERVFCHLKT